MAAISLDAKSDKNGLLTYDGAQLDDELVIVARLRCIETGEREDAQGDTSGFSKWKAYAIETVHSAGDRKLVVDLVETIYAERTGKQALPMAAAK